ncbi:MAG: C25 family cysteine peptidase [Chitinophagaceae bacterium]|nr:C25 family cysteine peptidase [Chitinophagaceae bacterium]
MPRLLTILALWCLSTNLPAQSFRNEWIDYNKVYFKFPVRETRLYRISKTVLNSAGLGSVPAEHFQLWRNGEEVPLFTTQETGPLADNGYIEFIGRRQDGKPDNELFDKPESQVLYDLSFFSDTAWHYLTVNPAGNNKRIKAAANNVATTNLPVEQFYIHQHRQYQQYTWNYGEGRMVGIPADNDYPPAPVVRSAVFNAGEGWTGQPFNNWFPLRQTVSNLQYFPGGGNFELSYSVSGNYGRSRNIQIFINDSLVAQSFVNLYGSARDTVQGLPPSLVTADALNFRFSSDNDFYWENCLINVFALRYPRRFNFLNSGFTEFRLQANTNGNHLRLARFRSDNQPTLLYDLTNMKRYVGAIRTDSSFFALDPSSSDREIVVTNQVSSLTQITTLTRKEFISFANAALQGDYLIITNKVLQPSSGIDNIELYRQYRSSPEGGSYNARVYDIDELAEQFAFGLRKHPLAIRHFLKFAFQHFATRPKYVFLVGKGSYYEPYRVSGNFAGKEIVSAVPTFGSPASDNLLAAASNSNTIPLLPIGRLNAVSNEEVGIYLDKVKRYEALLKDRQKPAAAYEWQKQVVMLPASQTLQAQIDSQRADYDWRFMQSFIQSYANKLKNARFAQVTTEPFVNSYTPRNPSVYPEFRSKLQQRLDSGVAIISLFGHSSTTNVDFGFKHPDTYPEQNGRYPIVYAHGCLAGNLFDMNTNRLLSTRTALSDSYIFTRNRGAIAFISNSNAGDLIYQNLINEHLYGILAHESKGKSLGKIQQETLEKSISMLGLGDVRMQQQSQQIILHGDPAIIPFPYDKPDYATASGDITLQPVAPHAAHDSVWVTAVFRNIGRSTTDTVWLELKRRLPNGEEKLLTRMRSGNMAISDTLRFKMSLRGIFEAGTNYLIATADAGNEQAEESETNNQATLSFDMNANAALPVFPYDLSIVNKPGARLTASTADPIARRALYRFQVDTSRHFNSPLLLTIDTNTIGGAITVAPAISYRNNTVYYWRVSPVNAGLATQWQGASFLYKTDAAEGFNQSHYFQHQQSGMRGLALDSLSRRFRFDDRLQHLFIEHGIYSSSGTEASHFSVVTNSIRNIANACLGQSIIFNVYDPITFKPWENTPANRYGSAAPCGALQVNNFEFKYFNHTNRKLIMDFLDAIPRGMYVVARLVVDPPHDSLKVEYWKRDTAIYGKGKSLYHALYNQGFYQLDSLNRTRTFGFVFKKDDSLTFRPVAKLSDGIYDRVSESVFITTLDTTGTITSPPMGPAASWKELYWNHFPTPGAVEPASARLALYGMDAAGNRTLLDSLSAGQPRLDISQYPTSQYPFLQVEMKTEEFRQAKPEQLDFWRATYLPVADGALSARDHLVWNYDTLLAIRDTLKLGLAFKNVSNYVLDSTQFTLKMGMPNGTETVVQSGSLRALMPGDTARISYQRLTDGLYGRHYLKLEVNTDRKPTEQFWFNNTAWLPFSVDTAQYAATIVGFKAEPGANKIVASWNVQQELKVRQYEVLYGTDSTNMTVFATAEPANQGLPQLGYTREHATPVLGNNYYRLRITDRYGNVITTPAVLVQVTVTSFRAQAGSSNNIGGAWRTINEVKLENYAFQHSRDKNTWSTVSTRTPANLGAPATDYAVAHSSPSLGMNYYRLQFTDQYGSSFTSWTDSVNIHLQSFNAAVAGKNVTLNWSFMNEINILDYQLEESDDSLRFRLVQTLAPTRNAGGLATYESVRSNMPLGFHYFRVRITDRNGNITYSAVQRVYVGDPAVVAVFPNPFTTQIRLVTGDLNTPWQLQLFDAAGRLVLSRTGAGPVNIPTHHLTKGIYFLKMQKGQEQQTWKMQKR